MSRDVVLGGRQCSASIQIDGINYPCKKDSDEPHETHVTYKGVTFSDSESWDQVFAREQEQQRRWNAEIEARPGQEMTKS